MGHQIRVNCGNCNRLFYCNGKDLSCAECKAYPSNIDNTGNPESKENEMNKLPDPFQPFGKATATCVRCMSLFNSSLNPGAIMCEACASGIVTNKIYEVTRKTCSSCKTIWAFTPEADKTKCPRCNQLYERTESVRQEERNKITERNLASVTLNLRIKELRDEITGIKTDLSRKEDMLSFLLALRGSTNERS